MPTNRFVESSFWNFDSLFVPQQHPAREMQDTFYLKGESSSSSSFLEATADFAPLQTPSPRTASPKTTMSASRPSTRPEATAQPGTATPSRRRRPRASFSAPTRPPSRPPCFTRLRTSPEASSPPSSSVSTESSGTRPSMRLIWPSSTRSRELSPTGTSRLRT